MQGLEPAEYKRQKEEVADSIVARLEAYLPGITQSIIFRRAAPHPPQGLGGWA